MTHTLIADRKRIVFALLCVLAVCVWPGVPGSWARSSPSAGDDAPAVRSTREAWFTLETRGTVEPADIELVREALEGGAESLMRYFNDPQLATSLQSVSVRVIVHAEPSASANETTATTRSGTRDGTVESYFSEIHLLAPSSHPKGLMTSIGEPKDAGYFGRLLVHELSTAPLDLTTRIKPSGWRLHSAPAWFVQGYEEYLGMTCAPGDAGNAALDRRTSILADNPERVDDSFGLNIRDPYVTGAVVLRFMHEQYGGERVKGILTSTESTFGRAARAALGVNLDGFMRDWRVWIERQ